ncbi:hypothetical protein [Pseudarthrobacter chlorophenolicus]|nr:hypothetical protein [Pseudarthrobacter chlorophenolicus]
MTPRSDHSYFLPRYGLAFEASWPRQSRKGSDRFRAWIHDLFMGGPTPGSPEHTVSQNAFVAAVELLEAEDIGAATMAFTDLGYDVTVHALR